MSPSGTGKKIAVVTGASSGFGAAAARLLARDGFEVVGGARRLERVQEVVEPLGGTSLRLDVDDVESVRAFAEAIPRADVLVNNAGLALGLEPVAEADETLWRRMFETNVLGLLRVTQALLPALLAAGQARGDALIVNVGSIAGFESYPGGAGYTVSKHAVRTLTRTLRIELLGKPVRVTELCPGLADTEFSLVRFDGDAEKARAVYRGMEPLTGEDVAECIRWVASLPAHVNIDEIVVRPRDQAAATLVHRRDEGP